MRTRTGRLGTFAAIPLTVALLLTACVGYRGDTIDLVFTGARGDALHGTLVLPANAETPVPAVVVLHGAERATRKKFAYRMQMNLFVERGIAAFMYDKRGTGESGGDFETSTYADLVADAVAAVEVLRRQPEIDGKAIGLMGASESGWLTPEIAERSGGLAFVVNKVGSPLSVRETVAWEVYNDLQAEGVSEESARQQVEVLRRLWQWRIAPTEEDGLRLEVELARWAGREDSTLPTELERKSEAWVADMSYDPGPYLERLTTPFLYLYGSEDINIPARESVARLSELAASGRPVSFHVYEGQGHELAEIGWRPPFYRFLDGYAERIGQFALEHVDRPGR